MAKSESRVEAHYTRAEMAERILEVLRANGVNVDALTHQDLMPYDEFHVRGRQATVSLVEQAGFAADMHVLDVGSGLGGPARYLAATAGCRVTGIDLTEEYVRTANVLAERVGLADRVRYQRASALDLPFDDAAFDGALTQHVQMNIEDKARLYAETARVLKPGARFAAYDILAGPSGAPHYPCPWAADATTSFLIAPEDWRAVLEASGFSVEHWRDVTDAALAWFAEMAEKAAQNPALVETRAHIMGAELGEHLANLRKSISEGRALLIETVCRRA